MKISILLEGVPIKEHPRYEGLFEDQVDELLKDGRHITNITEYLVQTKQVLGCFQLSLGKVEYDDLDKKLTLHVKEPKWGAWRLR